MTRVALFVDVQNVYYTTRQAYQRQCDYTALYSRVAQMGQIVTANAYAIEPNDRKQANFQKALRDIGFNIKLKPHVTRRDGSSKGDWDVGIAIDVMDLMDEFDLLVLVSGDGDFDRLVERVKADSNRRCEVFGVEALTAATLKQAADCFHPIDERLLL